MIRNASMRVCASLGLMALTAASHVWAQEHDETDLAKKTQNPVSDLVSMPFQFNFNTGGDLEDGTLFNINFQPVVPVSLTDDWNVIARAIVPYLDIPTATGSESGLGDIQAQFYVTSKHPGSIVWGVGPVVSLPTATNAFSRTGTWAAGVGAVAVMTSGPWVYGGLINQFWPVEDTGGDPKFDQLVMQPFVNYNFGKGWALAFAPLITANWDADDSDDRWTVPIGGGITRTTHFGKQPLSLGLQFYHNVERPAGSAANQLRFVFSLLFPE